jgi:hypothetical protein
LKTCITTQVLSGAQKRGLKRDRVKMRKRSKKGGVQSYYFVIVSKIPGERKNPMPMKSLEEYLVI